MPKSGFSAIILAAGNSSRMGVPKLSLKFNSDNTFLEIAINEFLQFGCDEVVVVVNNNGSEYIAANMKPFANNVKIAINTNPDWGRFFSLKTGCLALTKKQATFIHNVDNPFVNHDVLSKLVAKIPEYDYVIPSYNGKGGHPVLISEDVVRAVISKADDQQHLKDFLNRFSSLKEDVDDEKVLVNINNQDDYKKYFSDIV